MSKLPQPLMRPLWSGRLLFALLLPYFLSACSANQSAPVVPPPSPDVVRIVSSLPTRGAQAAQGRAMKAAIDLAIEDQGSMAGAWKVEHVPLDGSDGEGGEWSTLREEANAGLAADDPSVVAYIGPYTSGATGVALPTTSRAGLLHVGPSATWPGLTLQGWNAGEPGIYYPTGARNFVRVMPPDSRQAIAAARWAAALGIRRVVALSDGSSYSQGLALGFVEAARQAGMDPAGPEQISAPEQATDALQFSGAEAVFYAPSTVGQAVALARLLARDHPDLTAFTSDIALSDQFLEGVANIPPPNWRIIFNGAALEGGAQAEDFTRRYMARYGSTPGQFAANTYDLTRLVLSAVNAHGRDRARVREQVMATRGYKGASGTITFDERGDPVGWRMTGYRVEGGSFVLDRLLTSPPPP